MHFFQFETKCFLKLNYLFFKNTAQLLNLLLTVTQSLLVFLKFCPHGHLRDHLPTSRGKSWTFDQPPTHLILSTWFLNDPLSKMVSITTNKNKNQMPLLKTNFS